MGVVIRSGWCIMSPGTNFPLTQSCNGFVLLPGSGPTLTILLSFVLMFILQATEQKTHVVSVDLSGMPAHLPIFSDKEPVGQTSIHAPQNSQPASFCDSPNAVPTITKFPRWTKLRTSLCRISLHTLTQRPQSIQRL